MNERLDHLFAAIDRMDADGFVSFLTEDACFRFGNAPVVRGKDGIRNAVGQFFSTLRGLRHRLTGTWPQGDVIVCEGEVTYTPRQGSDLKLPFVDVLRMEGALIKDYRIYMDISPLLGSSSRQ